MSYAVYNRYMKIFSGSSSRDLTKRIASHLSLDVSPHEHHVFPDGEQRIMIEEKVLGQDTIVVQSTGTPVDTNYMELFFLIDGLMRSGAKSVTVVVPYFGYQRQDHVFREGEARSLEIVIRFLEEAGADRFVGIDFHSIKIPELFTKPVVHLSAMPVFAEKIKALGFLTDQDFLVSPDMGGIRRIGKLSVMLDEMPYVAVEKNRDLASGNLNASVIHGDVGRRAIIVDDMISSGKTIALACDLLSEKGVDEMYVFATHAVFSDEAPEILQKSKATKVFVTDTLFIEEKKRFEKLETLTVSDMIAGALSSK